MKMAKMAAPDRQVVAVCGDGSFQMSMCELATIRQNNVPVKIIVFNNGYLGLVRQFQHYNYADNYSVVDLSGNPDLEKLASAYDMPFIRVHNMSEVDEAIEKFLKDDNRYLMECMINPMAVVKQGDEDMRRIYSVLVENRSGVLCKVAGLFSRRCYNIDSLAVGETDDPDVSCMTIVSSGDQRTIEQIEKQLNKKLSNKQKTT